MSVLHHLPDAINAGFEFVGGMMQLWNCWKLFWDREVRGVNWQVTAFFACWGIWNLFFYPFVGAWLSMIGGLTIVLANVIWVAMALHFAKGDQAPGRPRCPHLMEWDDCPECNH